jgi:CBS domain containing-hemolysin-like protein
MLLLGGITWNKPIYLFLHDTYLVIVGLQLSLVGALVMGIEGTGYWLIIHQKGRPLKLLSGIHLGVTVGVFWFTLVLVALLENPSFNPGATYAADWQVLSDLISFGFVGLLICKMVYLLNLVIGWLRKE